MDNERNIHDIHKNRLYEAQQRILQKTQDMKHNQNARIIKNHHMHGGVLLSKQGFDYAQGLLRRRAEQFKERMPQTPDVPYKGDTSLADKSSYIETLNFLFMKATDSIRAEDYSQSAFEDIYKIIKILGRQGYLLSSDELENYDETVVALTEAVDNAETNLLSNRERSTLQSVKNALEMVGTILIKIKEVSKDSLQNRKLALSDLLRKMSKQLKHLDFISEEDDDKAGTTGIPGVPTVPSPPGSPRKSVSPGASSIASTPSARSGSTASTLSSYVQTFNNPGGENIASIRVSGSDARAQLDRLLRSPIVAQDPASALRQQNVITPEWAEEWEDSVLEEIPQTRYAMPSYVENPMEALVIGTPFSTATTSPQNESDVFHSAQKMLGDLYNGAKSLIWSSNKPLSLSKLPESALLKHAQQLSSNRVSHPQTNNQASEGNLLSPGDILSMSQSKSALTPVRQMLLIDASPADQLRSMFEVQESAPVGEAIEEPGLISNAGVSDTIPEGKEEPVGESVEEAEDINAYAVALPSEDIVKQWIRTKELAQKYLKEEEYEANRNEENKRLVKYEREKVIAEYEAYYGRKPRASTNTTTSKHQKEQDLQMELYLFQRNADLQEKYPKAFSYFHRKVNNIKTGRQFRDADINKIDTPRRYEIQALHYTIDNDKTYQKVMESQGLDEKDFANKMKFGLYGTLGDLGLEAIAMSMNGRPTDFNMRTYAEETVNAKSPVEDTKRALNKLEEELASIIAYNQELERDGNKTLPINPFLPYRIEELRKRLQTFEMLDRGNESASSPVPVIIGRKEALKKLQAKRNKALQEAGETAQFQQKALQEASERIKEASEISQAKQIEQRLRQEVEARETELRGKESQVITATATNPKNTRPLAQILAIKQAEAQAVQLEADNPTRKSRKPKDERSPAEKLNETSVSQSLKKGVSETTKEFNMDVPTTKAQFKAQIESWSDDKLRKLASRFEYNPKSGTNLDTIRNTLASKVYDAKYAHLRMKYKEETASAPVELVVPTGTTPIAQRLSRGRKTKKSLKE